MTREQQLECLEIIAKAFDLEIVVEKTHTTRSHGFHFSTLKVELDLTTEQISLLWNNTKEEEYISNYIFFDGGGDRFSNGQIRPHNCSNKLLKHLIYQLQNKQLLCHKLIDEEKKTPIDEYKPYRNAYVPSFSSPEELRLKLAINGNKQ